MDKLDKHKLEPIKIDCKLSFAVASNLDNRGVFQKFGGLFITEVNI